MSESSPDAPPPSKLDPLDLLLFIARRKRAFLGIPLGAAVAAAVISLLMPNYYAGVTKILPPQQNQSSAAMALAQLGPAAGVGAASLALKNPNDLYVGMLKSRTVADHLIERFGLQKLYDRSTLQDTRRVLESRTAMSHGRDGIITVQVEDTDPARAADIANGYIEELYKLTQTLAVTEAGQRRLFLERQLKLTRDALADAEVELKKTQEATGLFKLDDQGKAIIEAVAKLRGQIAAKEVEAATMRQFATERNPAYIRAQTELAGLRLELTRMEKASQGTKEGDILIPTGKVPEAGLEYVRRFRDVKYYETVFELLARQFEIAKIDEARDTSIVQVLDRALPPERKSRPHRSLIVVVTGVAAVLAAFLWALVADAWERAAQDGEKRAKLERLKALLRRRRAAS
jgi:tyrosine-protein kinase Etk/Wzc